MFSKEIFSNNELKIINLFDSLLEPGIIILAGLSSALLKYNLVKLFIGVVSIVISIRLHI